MCHSDNPWAAKHFGYQWRYPLIPADTGISITSIYHLYNVGNGGLNGGNLNGALKF